MTKAEDEARVLEAARRFHEEFGTTVAKEIGTDSLPLIELYLIMHGYLDGEPTLTEPRDN
jgi:hypothetical protein